MSYPRLAGRISGLLLALFLAVGNASAQRLTTLHSYSDTNVSQGVIADASGNFYGTTEDGGAYGQGTVFKLSRTGVETVLYSFTGGSDGYLPNGGLVMDGSGNLYGTTFLGGANDLGTVFKVTPAGAETVLYSFGRFSADSSAPLAGLIMDASGILYGTTLGGGEWSQGTVFRVKPTGDETLLYSFPGNSYGRLPQASLIMDASGNLYGTTPFGGADDTCCGTVFELTPGGVETVLYSFTGASDGSVPNASLIMDASGNVYGTTEFGGTDSLGTVFKLTNRNGTWIETVLHSFTGGSDGLDPESSLIMDATGNLYGTTPFGGSGVAPNPPNIPGDGVVFKVTPAGAETVIYSFTGGSDGSGPDSGLIADSSGNLYGTTEWSGGTIFELSGSGFVPPDRVPCHRRWDRHSEFEKGPCRPHFGGFDNWRIPQPCGCFQF
jgi:uncharacterized repeat protein (TIGR03803 family)